MIFFIKKQESEENREKYTQARKFSFSQIDTELLVAERDGHAGEIML